MTEENVIAIYHAAVTHNGTDLISACKHVMMRFYPILHDNQDFIELDNNLKQEIHEMYKKYEIKREKKVQIAKSKLKCFFINNK